jgi:hypothetical protein
MRLMAEREDKSDIEVIRKKILSIRLTKNLLEELVEIIDREYKDIKKQSEKENSSVSFSYAIEEKDGEIKGESPTKFLRHDISPDLRSIYMRLYSKDLKISVKIHLRLSWPYTYTEVEGSDSRLVNGISAQLLRVFNNHKHKTRNDFFHSKESLIISVPIGIVVGILYSITINDQIGKAINLILWPIISTFGSFLCYIQELRLNIQSRLSLEK